MFSERQAGGEIVIEYDIVACTRHLRVEEFLFWLRNMRRI